MSQPLDAHTALAQAEAREDATNDETFFNAAVKKAERRHFLFVLVCGFATLRSAMSGFAVYSALGVTSGEPGVRDVKKVNGTQRADCDTMRSLLLFVSMVALLNSVSVPWLWMKHRDQVIGDALHAMAEVEADGGHHHVKHKAHEHSEKAHGTGLGRKSHATHTLLSVPALIAWILLQVVWLKSDMELCDATLSRGVEAEIYFSYFSLLFSMAALPLLMHRELYKVAVLTAKSLKRQQQTNETDGPQEPEPGPEQEQEQQPPAAPTEAFAEP